MAPGLGTARADPGNGSIPMSIDIPTIGTHALVVPLGEDDNGAMQAPTDPDTVGWYDLGVGVGAPGTPCLMGTSTGVAGCAYLACSSNSSQATPSRLPTRLETSSVTAWRGSGCTRPTARRSTKSSRRPAIKNSP